jgi:hypothetical protein
MMTAAVAAAVVATTITIVEAAEQARTAGVGAGVRASRGARGDRGRSDFTTNHAADIDHLFARDADANRTGRLAGNATRFPLGALHNALFGHALIRADLDLLFTPHVLANRDLARHAFGVANLLAHRHRAFPVLGAMDPHLLRARRAASVVAAVVVGARIVAAVAMVTAAAAEETAAATVAEQRLDFTAFPVAKTDELLLHAGFLHGFVARLVDHAGFPDGFLHADLAALLGPDRDALDTGHRAFAANRNAFAAERVILFRATFVSINRSFLLDVFTYPFITSRTAVRTVGGGRRA